MDRMPEEGESGCGARQGGVAADPLGDQMNDRLRAPGGRLGTLSLASAYLLAVVGVAGMVMLTTSLALDLDLWSDRTSDEAVGVAVFGLAALGAVGFLVQDRHLTGGTLLAVIGCLAFGTIVFWAVLPVLLGIGVAVVAVCRRRALAGRAVRGPRSALA